MKILIIQETDWIKRYPAQQHHLAEMMSLKGHEVRAIDHALLWKNDPRKGFYSRREVFSNITKIHKRASVRVIRPGFIKIHLLDYLSMMFSHQREIKRQIGEFQPDVIVGFGILNSFLAIRTIKRTRIPFIYYWIDVLHLLIPAKAFRRLGKAIESASLKRADRVLTINDSLNDLVINMGASSYRTRVLRAGINLKLFSLSNEYSTMRASYGFKENDVVLFFMGFLYQFSGLKEVALTLAESNYSRVKLLIVGEGDLYSELKEIREKYNLRDRIILTGKKTYDEIPSHIAASDICLLPAYIDEPIMQDIVPIKIYEYMAMKKPVISTKLPGIWREFGDDNGVEYVEKPEDVVAKAMALVSNGRLSELGDKARNFAERNSWDKIADEFEKILLEVVKEKRK